MSRVASFNPQSLHYMFYKNGFNWTEEQLKLDLRTSIGRELNTDIYQGS